MGNRFRQWRRWKKYNLNGKLYQLLVLIGVIHSPTFEVQKETYMLSVWFDEGFTEGLKKAEERYDGGRD